MAHIGRYYPVNKWRDMMMDFPQVPNRTPPKYFWWGHYTSSGPLGSLNTYMNAHTPVSVEVTREGWDQVFNWHWAVATMPSDLAVITCRAMFFPATRRRRVEMRVTWGTSGVATAAFEYLLGTEKNWFVLVNNSVVLISPGTSDASVWKWHSGGGAAHVNWGPAIWDVLP